MPPRRSELRESLRCHAPQSTTVQVAAALAQKLSSPVRRGRILLVEDSPISQTVLSDMLRKLGHHVEVVGTGNDAISRCQAQSFDLVLMDIQMPETDGHEATIQIRAAEKLTGQHQFIVALTAHAMPRDRIRCQEVGMDGFLVKPITFEALQQAVEAVLDPSRKADHVFFNDYQTVESQGANSLQPSAQELTSETSLTVNSTEESLANASTVSVEKNIESLLDDAPSWPQLVQMFDNNVGLLSEVLSLLNREAPRLQRLYETSLERGNCAEARRAVHTLKSNARYVGLTKMAEAAERLEQLARDGQLQLLKDNAAALVEMIDRVVNWTEIVQRSK